MTDPDLTTRQTLLGQSVTAAATTSIIVAIAMDSWIVRLVLALGWLTMAAGSLIAYVKS